MGDFIVPLLFKMTNEVKLECNACKEWKGLDDFYHNEKQYAKSRHYRSGFCKVCARERNVKYNEKRKEDKIDVEKEAKTILSKIGYDTKSEIPIHIQFEKKWGL